MNVIFFTFGEGFGHIARDLAIADELKKKGHKVVISTYSEAAEKTRRESDFEVVDIPRYSTYSEDGGKFNVLKFIVYSIIPTLLSPLSALKSHFIIKKYNADVIVIDEYVLSLPAAILSGKPIFFITNCLNPAGAYANIFSTWTNMPLLDKITVLVGAAMQKAVYVDIFGRFSNLMLCDFLPPNTIAKYNVKGLSKNLIYVGPLSRETPEKLPSVRKIKKELGLGKFILVTRGKYGQETELIKILEDLSKLGNKHNIIVMGSSDAKFGNVMVRKFNYRKYLKYLKACDLVITHGGHSTMMECCIFGKPMVLIVADNYGERMGNALGATKLGIAELIPSSKLTSEKLHKAVDKMLKRKAQTKKIADLAKKENGAVKAAYIIESMTS